MPTRRRFIAGGLTLGGAVGGGFFVWYRNPRVSHLDATVVDPPLSLFEREFDLEIDDPTVATAVLFGSSSDSHVVVLLAEASEPLQTSIAVRRTDRPALDRPFHTETLSLAVDSCAVLRFEQRGTYAITVDSSDHSGSIAVPRDLIDCNHSHQAVLLTERGSVESTGMTTDMACRPW